MNHTRYWKERWERGDVGWHQLEVEPNLEKYFAGLPPTRIFVPLCGKSLDLTWLVGKGHEVIGVELSEVACSRYFEENQLSYKIKSSLSDRFLLYQGTQVTLMNGDIFDLTADDLGKIGAVYDRAALIALPPQVRPGYVNQLKQIIRTCAKLDDFRLLQIVLERTPQDIEGPPFSVSSQELALLYGDDFEIALLNRERIDEMGTKSSVTDECTYFINARNREI